MQSFKRELVLEGLCCPNCASKIEKEVRNIEGVKGASVDFISKSLTIEAASSYDLEKIAHRASKIATEIEPQIRVCESGKSSSAKKAAALDKGEVFNLSLGIVLFAAALVFDFPHIVKLTVFFMSYLLLGGKVLLIAAKNIARGRVFDENFLMGIATIGAFAIGEFPEAVAVMLFYRIGELFQRLAIDNSRRSIAALMDIRPDYANLKIEEEIKRVSPQDVAVGDTIVIKPGEKVPLDGVVMEGSSYLDTSAITGESLPREVGPMDTVLSGTINKNGLLTVKVSKLFGESTASKILDLVSNASSKKAKTENFITRFARYYTPAIVFCALALAVIPPLILQNAYFSDWLHRGLVFLVVSCPCALVISIPLGFFGGIGGASKQGILVKGGNYLEALSGVDTVVFDKTGTLTKGIFKVVKAYSPMNDEASLIEIAAHAESYSTHPIALSIIEKYGKEIDKVNIGSYEEVPGMGTKAVVFGKRILAGNAKLMESENVAFEKASETGTIVYIAENGVYAGYIVVADEVKEDAAGALKKLSGLGVKRMVMLTGDGRDKAEKIGSQLGISEIYAELLPQQKVEKLEDIQQQKIKGKVLYVGDGINDAPVLARADVGMAMGGLGSDAAIEASDIVIMTDEPSRIADAIRIARRTKAVVWQNIIFAFAVKAIILLMGAGGIATLWEAVFADVGVALIAIFNSLRVLKAKNI